MLNKMWIVSSYGNNIDWVDSYTSNYIIYDKTCKLPETEKIKHQKNVGYNIYDYFSYIVDNYENLPDICVFIKGNIFNRLPEPHCTLEKFNKLINNSEFTPLESYEHIPVSSVHIKGEDGGYCEVNEGCWYGSDSVKKYFNSYNQFLSEVFINQKFPKWIRFAPGANYIVPKNNILFYSKKFYKKLISYVDYHQTPSEAHLIERAMYTIFKNEYSEK